MKQQGLSLIIIGLLMVLIMFQFMYYVPWDDGTFRSYLIPCYIVIGFGVIITALGYWGEGFDRN